MLFCYEYITSKTTWDFTNFRPLCMKFFQKRPEKMMGHFLAFWVQIMVNLTSYESPIKQRELSRISAHCAWNSINSEQKWLTFAYFSILRNHIVDFGRKIPNFRPLCMKFHQKTTCPKNDSFHILRKKGQKSTNVCKMHEFKSGKCEDVQRLFWSLFENCIFSCA